MGDLKQEQRLLESTLSLEYYLKNRAPQNFIIDIPFSSKKLFYKTLLEQRQFIWGMLGEWIGDQIMKGALNKPYIFIGDNRSEDLRYFYYALAYRLGEPSVFNYKGEVEFYDLARINNQTFSKEDDILAFTTLENLSDLGKRYYATEAKVKEYPIEALISIMYGYEQPLKYRDSVS